MHYVYLFICTYPSVAHKESLLPLRNLTILHNIRLRNDIQAAGMTKILCQNIIFWSPSFQGFDPYKKLQKSRIYTHGEHCENIGFIKKSTSFRCSNILFFLIVKTIHFESDKKLFLHKIYIFVFSIHVYSRLCSRKAPGNSNP